MRWIIRHAVFALCLSLGASTWYILAQKKRAPALPAQAQEESIANRPTPKLYADGLVASGPTFEFRPVLPMSGLANAKTIVLREHPNAEAKVVARLQMGDYEPAEILGANRDFVHVRFAANGTDRGDAEGWTTWGSVVADLAAIVMDAETGEVISRIPLKEGMTTATFSPDSSRAIFSGASEVGYEIRTSDYTPTRSLRFPNNEYLKTLFYGPSDGVLYATLPPSRDTLTEVRLFRIADSGTDSVAFENELAKTGFGAVSPDGLLGFRTRVESGEEAVLLIDVFDLTTFKLRNTFKLSGANMQSETDSFILSRDGSELFLRLSGNYGTIPVVDTRTGQVVRELSDFSTKGWSYFSQQDLIGDSILLRVWETGDDDIQPPLKKFWISNGRSMLAEPGIDLALDAAGKRYAVNHQGTLLFGLDDNNRIQTRRAIARPERRNGATMGNDLTVLGFTASPDGKRLVLFVGIEHGC